MKRTILLIFSITLLTLSSCSQGERRDTDDYNLKGDVKSIYVTSYGAVKRSGNVVKASASTSGTESYYFQNYQCEFNPSGMLESETTLTPRGKQTEKIVNTYNDEGKIIEKCNYLNASLNSRYIYEYQNDGKLKYETGYVSSGDVITKMEYFYDEPNTVECKIIDAGFFSDGSYTTLLKSGKKVAHMSYDESGFAYSTKRYDNKERVYEDEVLDHFNWEMVTMSFEYNDNGDISKSINAMCPSKSGYTFSYGDTYYYDYKLDEKRNWISRTTYKGEDREPLCIEERSIIYY